MEVGRRRDWTNDVKASDEKRDESMRRTVVKITDELHREGRRMNSRSKERVFDIIYYINCLLVINELM